MEIDAIRSIFLLYEKHKDNLHNIKYKRIDDKFNQG